MVVAFATTGVKAVARATEVRMFVKRVIVLFLFEGGVGMVVRIASPMSEFKRF
jgi:hypothetical protein